jgi:hypothetical protein
MEKQYNKTKFSKTFHYLNMNQFDIKKLDDVFAESTKSLK